ncbi:aldehyde dehydrogenase family protein [Streptomyces olivaceus]
MNKHENTPPPTEASLVDGTMTTAGNDGSPGAPHTASPAPQHGVSRAQVAQAVRAARRDEGALRCYEAEPRARLLETLAHLVEKARPELIEVTGRETNLSDARLEGELTRTTGQLQGFARAVREGHYFDAILDVPDGAQPDRTDIRRVARAVGPVAVWPASNFPFAFGVLGGDTASALAAGCPVVVKAHPAHPETSEHLARIALEALTLTGLPTGVLQVLHSADNDLSQFLVRHPDVRAAAFTGSLRGGRALYDAASSRTTPIPVYAEMGSLNPVFVTAAAARERGAAIASELASAITGSVGQLCTKPGIVIVPRGVDGDAFVRRLASDLAGTTVHPMLTSGIREAYEQRIAATRALPSVATLLGPIGAGAVALFEIDETDLEDSGDALEEHFGPASVIVRSRDADAFLPLLRRMPSGLTASLFCQDEETPSLSGLWEALAAHAGRLLFGQMPTGVPVGWATVHGGPYPATTDAATTSVGFTAVRRFQAAVAYQNTPQALLPAALRDDNPLRLTRLINGSPIREPLPQR